MKPRVSLRFLGKRTEGLGTLLVAVVCFGVAALLLAAMLKGMP